MAFTYKTYFDPIFTQTQSKTKPFNKIIKRTHYYRNKTLRNNRFSPFKHSQDPFQHYKVTDGDQLTSDHHKFNSKQKRMRPPEEGRGGHHPPSVAEVTQRRWPRRAHIQHDDDRQRKQSFEREPGTTVWLKNRRWRLLCRASAWWAWAVDELIESRKFSFGCWVLVVLWIFSLMLLYVLLSWFGDVIVIVNS